MPGLRVILSASCAAAAMGLVAAGCGGGGGGGGGAANVSPLATASEAAAFLTQATFGPTTTEIEQLTAIGYQAWLDQQMQTAPSLQVEYLNGLALGPTPPQQHRIDAWWNNAVGRQDQLRQRVAFALSQIFVISEVDLAGPENTVALATYYDLLARNAFGNYRTLLEAVTLSPAMGVYLSHVRNEKPDLARNIRPDENYAREVMQLFSIGLVELNRDGTARVDTAGVGIPTYTQEIIEGYAHVFTGWTYARAPSWRNPGRNMVEPMEPFEEYHDTGAKSLLNSVQVPPGGTARADLEIALNSIANHPNVPPFVCKQLIQRLVTSNPTPAYVERVARVFEDDGTGERGDLGAVVRAILLDEEARRGWSTLPQRFGKLREPLLRQTALWRAFNARSGVPFYLYPNPERDFQQAPLRSPSVFNFYRPDYAPAGEITTAGLAAPELQITNESTMTATTNRLQLSVFNRYIGASGTDNDDVLIDITREKALAGDPTALVDHLDLLLLSGRMTPGMRGTVTQHVNATPLGDGTQRALEAIFLIVSSPEFAFQR